MGRVVRVVVIVVVIGAGLFLVYLYRTHRSEVTREQEREEPVIAPSRVRDFGGEALIVLDSADVRRIGLQVAALGPAVGGSEVHLPAEVTAEPERVAVLRAPIAGRLAVPEGARWPGFGDQVAEGTEVAQVSDARPLVAPLSGTVTRVGARPGELVEAGQELLQLTDYSRPMVRVPWADGAAARPPARLLLRPDGAKLRVPARLIGAAAEADPVTRRPAFLYRAERGWPGATPGTPVIALLAHGGLAGGVLLPDHAVVQWEGLTWTYLQRGPGRYLRRRVSTDRPAAGGWIVGAPFRVGDTVVVIGAEQLLSEEFRARVTVGEEAGE
jgi:biotin carboxyl carrier protein